MLYGQRAHSQIVNDLKWQCVTLQRAERAALLRERASFQFCNHSAPSPSLGRKWRWGGRWGWGGPQGTFLSWRQVMIPVAFRVPAVFKVHLAGAMSSEQQNPGHRGENVSQDGTNLLSCHGAALLRRWWRTTWDPSISPTPAPGPALQDDKEGKALSQASLTIIILLLLLNKILPQYNTISSHHY